MSADLSLSTVTREYTPAYGDLTALNTDRTILDGVGGKTLREIVSDFVDLLHTSAAVYEKNGDYALGIFAANWCRCLDSASRKLCGDVDNRVALDSKKWLCHESCWTDASLAAIKSGETVDIACHGGLRIYALPIIAGQKVIGAINFGYGAPPQSHNAIASIAKKYGLATGELTLLVDSISAPGPREIELAKKRLRTTATLIASIVELHQSQEALAESEERYHALFERAPLGYQSLGETGHFIEVNQAWLDTLGYERREVIGRWFGDFLAPEYVDAFRERFPIFVKNGKIHSEFFMIHKNGERRYIVFEGRIGHYPDGSFMQTHCILSDETERKRIESEIEKSEEKYATLYTTMVQGVVYQDADGKVISANPAAERILGLSIGQMMGRLSTDPRWGVIHEDGSSYPGETHPAMIALKTGKEQRNCIMGIYHADEGRHVWVSVNAIPLFLPGQTKPFQVYATLEDITDRRVAEQNYQMIFREMLDGFALHEIICDPSGKPVDYRFLAINPAFERMTGLKSAEIIGRTVIEAMPDIEQHWIDTYGRVALTGEGVFFENYSDGLKKHFQVTAFRPAPGQFACIFKDITEKQIVMDTLQRTAKLEALGVLAGGIAHDFNNLLGGIFGYIDMAHETSSDPDVSSYIAKALSTVDRARGLTRQLLTFAKGGTPVRHVEPLFPFAQETVQFALSGSSVSSRFEIGQNLWNCDYDKNQIGQVIDNLVINAQQSMPLGGIITVTARNSRVGIGEHPTLSEGNYVKLSVKDTGTGIAKDLLLRIFDPFFTTKSKGHGLGLATCYSIISRHGGCIDVESQQGAGSTFHVYLPAAREQVSTPKVVEQPKHVGRGTILVMDDEEVMREAIGDMLSTLGYTILSATNGQDAIDIFVQEQKEGRTFAALFFDLTIPGGMGGAAAIGKIRKLCTQTPAFVISGYSEDPVVACPSNYGFTASLCKPFRRSELIALLNEHLVKRGI